MEFEREREKGGNSSRLDISYLMAQNCLELFSETKSYWTHNLSKIIRETNYVHQLLLETRCDIFSWLQQLLLLILVTTMDSLK